MIVVASAFVSPDEAQVVTTEKNAVEDAAVAINFPSPQLQLKQQEENYWEMRGN